MKRIVSIGIVVLLCLLVFMTGDNAKGDNLAGDLDQLPEHEEMLDMKDGTIRAHTSFSPHAYVYNKDNFVCYDLSSDGGNIFDGTYAKGTILESRDLLTIVFPYPLNITRIRIYPMGNDDVLGCTHLSIWSTVYPIFYTKQLYSNIQLSEDIQDKTDYIEVEFSDFITPSFTINCGGGPTPPTLNEVEIYYNRYYNPYHSTSEVNYNYTNITNEYINETYITNQNDTYVNNTYENTTYQNDTYLNQTNETGVTYENVTHEHLNTTYSNDTTITDTQRLEDKIDGVWEQLNQTDSKEIEKESKSLADKTYTDPILIILLLAILIFQVILYIQRKRGRGEILEGKDTIEPEVEHTPSPGFSKEGEVDIITRKVQQEKSTDLSPPPTQYTQYQHRPPQPQQPQQPSTPIPPEQSMTPQPQVTTPQVQPPPQPPITPPPTQPIDNEQKALPEHQFTP